MSTHLAAPPGHSGFDVDTTPMQRVHTRERFLFGFGRAVREVYEYRELLGQLVRKELKIKYKDSFLGFLWTLVRPLMYLLVYSLAIGFFLGASRTTPAFGVYLFSGLVAWTLFTDIIGGCTGTIVSNAGLVKKVYLPMELFPLSVVGAALINWLLQVVILVGAWAVTDRWPNPANLPLVPLALLVLVVWGLALGLVLGTMNVYLRDIQYLVDVGLLLWFWMTPIVYTWTKAQRLLPHPLLNAAGQKVLRHGHVVMINHHVGWLYQIYLANPMANIVLAFQRAFWPQGQGTAYYYTGNLYIRLSVILGVSLCLLWLAQRIFARARGNFAQEL
jgi:ABC-2 type transport system permease protein